MWYEILPSAGIVFALLYAPNITNWGINKLLLNGKKCARDWDAAHYMDWTAYLRDRRITGSEYKPRAYEGHSVKIHLKWVR